MLNANLDLDNIISEYQRSEDSILKPMMDPEFRDSILIDNTNQGITASPSKRTDREGMYWVIHESDETTAMKMMLMQFSVS